VLDFGIAKLIHLDADVARSAGMQTGAILGTPMYMSPEQAFGEREIDGRTDIWSLGLILYQCLTGVLPTEAENLGQVLKIILTTELRPVSELAPSTPPALAKLVTQMLTSERAARPQTMQEVVDALKVLDLVSLPSSQPVEHSDPPSVVATDGFTPEARRERRARPTRTRSGVAAAVGLLLTGTAVVALTGPRPAGPDDASPSEAGPGEPVPGEAGPDPTDAGARSVAAGVSSQVVTPSAGFATSAERSLPHLSS
jgi:serine/threonine-protein kinase